jgi:hypothetical protein
VQTLVQFVFVGVLTCGMEDDPAGQLDGVVGEARVEPTRSLRQDRK